MENEPSLRALWAQLLASGLAGEKIDKTYVKALNELTGRDAKLLKTMHSEWLEIKDKKYTFSDTVSYELGVDVEKSSISTASKLFALGIVRPTYVNILLYVPGGESRHGDYGPSQEEAALPNDLATVRFTEFGESFCKALGMTARKTRRSKPRDSV
jgi:hypothetical protein